MHCTLSRTRHHLLMPYRVIEVLMPTTVRIPDVNGRLRTLKFTPARIRRDVAQANAQLKAGLRIPFAWEHDPNAGPAYLSHGSDLAWRAKGYFGDAVRFFQDPKTGRGLAKVYIPDEVDALQFDKVGQVSPGLWEDWTDERGVTWPGTTICHVAATPKPVQRHLGRPSPAAAAYRPTSTQTPRVSAAYHLSFPATPRSAAMPEDTEDMDTPAGTKIDIAEVVDLIKKLGIHGMEDVTEDTLVAALKAAVHTKLGGSEDEPMEDEMGDEAGDDDMGTASVPAPIMMSHSVAKKLGALEHEKLERRLKDCADAGQISKAQFEKEMTGLKAVNLSHATPEQFTKDGDRKRTEFDVRLEVYESLPKSGVAKRAAVHLGHGGATVAVPTPGQTKPPVGTELTSLTSQHIERINKGHASK